MMPLEARVRSVLIPFIEEKFHITLERKAFRVSQATIFLDLEPVVRARILQKKEAILSELQKNGIRDIKTIS